MKKRIFLFLLVSICIIPMSLCQKNKFGVYFLPMVNGKFSLSQNSENSSLVSDAESYNNSNIESYFNVTGNVMIVYNRWRLISNVGTDLMREVYNSDDYDSNFSNYEYKCRTLNNVNIGYDFLNKERMNLYFVVGYKREEKQLNYSNEYTTGDKLEFASNKPAEFKRTDQLLNVGAQFIIMPAMMTPTNCVSPNLKIAVGLNYEPMWFEGSWKTENTSTTPDITYGAFNVNFAVLFGFSYQKN